MNKYCYHNCLCLYTIITLLCISSHICSFILQFSYIYILHIVISFSIIWFCLSYIMNASIHSCIHIFIYIAFYIHLSYAFLSGFSYSCTFLYMLLLTDAFILYFILLFHITYSVMSLLCLLFMYMYLFLYFVIFYFSLSLLAFMPFYHVFLACFILFLSVCLSFVYFRISYIMTYPIISYHIL